MVDRPDHDEKALTLSRNRIIGWVAFVAFTGTGLAFVVVSLTTWRGPMGVLLGAFFIVPGLWAIPAMTRPWRFDAVGVWRGRYLHMTWPEVTSILVDDIRPTRAGMGPARVRVRLSGDATVVDVTLYSYRDAVALTEMLDERLTADTAGRIGVARIAQAWMHTR